MEAKDKDPVELWMEDRYFSNPDAVRRKLALINVEYVSLPNPGSRSRILSGPMRDDTTLIILRQQLTR